MKLRILIVLALVAAVTSTAPAVSAPVATPAAQATPVRTVPLVTG